VVFGDWIFFGATAATLFFYRSRERRGLETRALRFRVPGYPITPLIFILAALYVVVSSMLTNPANALKGTALIAFGVPVFMFWRRRALSHPDLGPTS
jgi:APA family basic amino acid/polyamine antiporter